MTRPQPPAITRRGFIASAVAASLAGAAPESPARTPIRAGLIGCGEGGLQIREAFSDTHGRFVPIVAASYSGKPTPHLSLPVAHDWRTLLDRADLDALFIATPDNLHAEMVTAALRAGKHVYLLPPFTRTGAEARQLESFARNCAGVLHVGMDPAEDARWECTSTACAQSGAPRWIQAAAHADLPREGGWQRDRACSHGPAARQLFNMLYPMQCLLPLGRHDRASVLGGVFRGIPSSNPDALLLTLSFETGTTVVLSSGDRQDTVCGQTMLRGCRASVTLPPVTAALSRVKDLDRFAEAIAGNRAAANSRLRAACVAQEAVSDALAGWAHRQQTSATHTMNALT